jgi:uncharacterized protein (TIGR00369 family)
MDETSRVHQSAAKQAFLQLIGAKVTKVAPGQVEFELPFREDLTQQHGFLHAGVVTTIADVACGYAAFSLMPAGSEVLSVEFKLNLLRPAVGDRFVARARVIKPGKSLTVTQAEVFAYSAEGEKHVATMLATMICK